MVYPVRPLPVDKGQEQLVLLGCAQLRHHTLQGIVVSCELRASYSSNIGSLEVFELVVKEAMRVTIPKQCIDVQ